MKRFWLAVVSTSILFMAHAMPHWAQVETYDLVIMNGRVVDGTGNPWFYGDVAIRGDRIVRVGRLGPSRAKRRIDATGMIVAPGFIDMLGHSEVNLLIDPRAESKVFQGITTEVTGEGGSIGPINDYILKEMEPVIKKFNLTIDFRTIGEYFARLERTPPAINIATYVGATQVRQYVLGDEDRAPTAAELDEMRKLVAQAMEDGAVGLSTSLVYAPAFYAKTEELIELAKVASRYGGIYATHMRNESNAIMPAIDEALRIGREARIPVEIFHLKMAGKQNWGKMAEVIKKIEEARARGLDVTADQYPYVAGATALSASIPPWAHEGGTQKLIERLKDPATREKLKKEMRTPTSEWENFYLGAGAGEGILVARVLKEELMKYQGKRVSEVARMMNKADEIDALFDLVIADAGQTGAIYFLMSEDDVKLAMKQPWLSIGVDHGAVATTGPLSEGRAHPRGYGSFPRILGKYVRDERVITLEEAIRKMTSLAANRVGLAERGLLKPGYFADVVVFAHNLTSDISTFEDPNRLSTGMRFVLVNGQSVIDGGKQTMARPGRPLRGPGYKPPRPANR
ncbi:MAG TPA: D-aminoacylase [Blastocatellia bacterium]|jgi:dihydroorotase/N-acyl-D-amino-acid deacylase